MIHGEPGFRSMFLSCFLVTARVAAYIAALAAARAWIQPQERLLALCLALGRVLAELDSKDHSTKDKCLTAGRPADWPGPD